MKKKSFSLIFILLLSIPTVLAQIEDNIDLLTNDFALLDTTSNEQNWGVFNTLIGDWICDTIEHTNPNTGLISCKPALDNRILILNFNLPYTNINDDKRPYKSLIIIHYSKTDVPKNIVYNDNNDLFVNLKMTFLGSNNELILTGSEKDSMIQLTFSIINEKMSVKCEISSSDSSSTLFKWKMLRKK
ncbi:MAG: hypothetical protein KFKLKKLM_00713 [Flavobacteriales bacterium]|nr:hypothetical protein [Flavobacteriales bacterium]